MSRFFRSFRTPMRPSMLPVHLVGGQTVRVERVRIRRGRPVTRFLATTAKGVAIFHLVMFAIPPMFLEEDDDDDHGHDHDHDHDHDYDPIFIPFPFTTTQIPSPPYSRHDPEWKEFVRISRDPELQQVIRYGTANHILKIAAKSRALTAKFGQDIRVSRFWLDIHYPYAPPPTYERSGILITDEALEWATVSCDSFSARLLDRILWPKPVALSAWTLGVWLVKPLTLSAWSQSVGRIKQTAVDWARSLGLASSDSPDDQGHHDARPTGPTPPPPHSEVQKALEGLRRQTTRRPEEVNDPSSMPSSTASSSPPSAPSASQDKAVGLPVKPAVGGSNGEAPQQTWDEWIRSAPLARPLKEAVRAYTQEWRPLYTDPPRGSLAVTGIVQLETPKVFILLDVVAWYHPQTKTLDQGSMLVRLRRIKEKQQAPLR